MSDKETCQFFKIRVMTKRSRRYFFRKKVNKMIITELSKNIQEEIDRQIVEQLIEIAQEQEVRTNFADWPTGTDEEGPYWLEPETEKKWRWKGPMVGRGQVFSPDKR